MVSKKYLLCYKNITFLNFYSIQKSDLYCFYRVAIFIYTFVTVFLKLIYIFLFHVVSKTQEFKLQLKLLQAFPNLIESLDLDGKHLNEISEIVSLYLSNEQPKDLQCLAIGYFDKLRNYNSSLIYLIVIKKSHLKTYKDNVKYILKQSFDIE